MSRGKRTHFLADLLKPPRFLNRIFLYLDLALSSQFGHTFLPITPPRIQSTRFSSLMESPDAPHSLPAWNL